MGARKKKTAVRKKAKKKAAPRRKKTAAKRRPRAPAAWGLALLGDWSRGAFLAGALEHLRTAGRLPPVTVAAGTGSGALVAALAALGKWHELRELFQNLSQRQVVRARYGWLPGGRAASFLLSTVTRTQSLGTTHDGLESLVRRLVDPAALRDAAWEVSFVATDLQSGALRAFHNRHDGPDDLLQGIVAAASRPVFMPLVRAGHHRHQHATGTLRGFAPLRTLFATLAREPAPELKSILAISTIAPVESSRIDDYGDIGDVLDRLSELLSGQLGHGDLRAAALINAILRFRDELGPKRFATLVGKLDDATRAEVESHLGKRYVPVLHVHPEAPPGAGALEGEPASSRAAYEAGAAAAERALG